METLDQVIVRTLGKESAGLKTSQSVMASNLIVLQADRDALAGQLVVLDAKIAGLTSDLAGTVELIDSIATVTDSPGTLTSALQAAPMKALA